MSRDAMVCAAPSVCNGSGGAFDAGAIEPAGMDQLASENEDL